MFFFALESSSWPLEQPSEVDFTLAFLCFTAVEFCVQEDLFHLCFSFCVFPLLRSILHFGSI